MRVTTNVETWEIVAVPSYTRRNSGLMLAKQRNSRADGTP